MKNSPENLVNDFVAPPCDEKIHILYEDQYLLAINKPSGLLSLSGKNPLNKDSVHYRMVQDYPTATMAHRLDFGTSGIMVLALNKAVNAHLTKQFQARSIVKTYQAILLGDLANNNGLVNAPIAKAEFPYQKVCFKKGKAAQTRYQVLERFQNSVSGVKMTKVLFTPLTGRTHQLRIHSREIGHPIIGCDLYGLTLNGIHSQSLAKRLMLHASSLGFEHPLTGERMHLHAQASFYDQDIE